ncbi:MAG TPA: HAMP domain-containing sensor histidine kinase, partial [Candidatus Limnocylindrales bacterium]|nr:HAMP domain-containing sensor histidine kinase [Candidatus Limnocylindrales bacterium]
VTHADGRVLWVRDSARCEPGTGDVRWICYGLISDITERQAVDQALRDRERLQMALEAERKVGEMRNRFMLVVSHEFRTPLSIILTSSEMLDRYYDRLGPERRQERLSIIRSQVQHLRAMLDEISIVIRAELGRLEYHPSPADAVEFTRQVAAEMAATAGLMHRIKVVAQPDMLVAYIDTTLLRHVLTNLLSNAIKFSEAQATVSLSVRLDTQTQPPAIVFEVADEGIGIEPTDLAHLFEPFFRGSNVGAISGTGLGLKVVKDCLARHGGSIVAESRLGLGSTFTASVPYHPAPQPEPILGTESDLPTAPQSFTRAG